MSSSSNLKEQSKNKKFQKHKKQYHYLTTTKYKNSQNSQNQEISSQFQDHNMQIALRNQTENNENIQNEEKLENTKDENEVEKVVEEEEENSKYERKLKFQNLNDLQNFFKKTKNSVYFPHKLTIDLRNNQTEKNFKQNFASIIDLLKNYEKDIELIQFIGNFDQTVEYFAFKNYKGVCSYSSLYFKIRLSKEKNNQNLISIDVNKDMLPQIFNKSLNQKFVYEQNQFDQIPGSVLVQDIYNYLEIVKNLRQNQIINFNIPIRYYPFNIGQILKLFKNTTQLTVTQTTVKENLQEISENNYLFQLKKRQILKVDAVKKTLKLHMIYEDRLFFLTLKEMFQQHSIWTLDAFLKFDYALFQKQEIETIAKFTNLRNLKIQQIKNIGQPNKTPLVKDLIQTILKKKKLNSLDLYFLPRPIVKLSDAQTYQLQRKIIQNLTRLTNLRIDLNFTNKNQQRFVQLGQQLKFKKHYIQPYLQLIQKLKFWFRRDIINEILFDFYLRPYKEDQAIINEILSQQTTVQRYYQIDYFGNMVTQN